MDARNLAKDPILMTDWNHRSAFQDWSDSLNGISPKMASALLNGTAMRIALSCRIVSYVSLLVQYKPSVPHVPAKFSTVFEKVRYQRSFFTHMLKLCRERSTFYA